MTREELAHAIRAACYVAREVNVYPKNHPDRSDVVDGVPGEGSQFQMTHGFYVHGVGPETAVLPEGWEWRLVPVRGRMTGGNTGWCLQVHDSAVSKLATGRPKDFA